MRTPALALLLLGAAIAAYGAADRRMLAEEAGGAIANGQTASPTRFRYWVLLDIAEEEGNCGASLIAPEVVLTAAHCVAGYEPGELRVRVGEYYRNESRAHPRVVRGVTEVMAHPKYSLRSNELDIALLKLDAPVTDIQPVKLVGSVPKPNWQNPAPDWTPVTVVGMGETKYDGPVARVLQQIELSLLPLRQCQILVSQFSSRPLETSFMTNDQICTLKLDGPGAECPGDSGGPLVVTGATMAEDVQIGIVSWSFKSPREKACLTIPGVYSDIGSLWNWVNLNVLRMTGARLTPGKLPVQPFTPMHGRVYGGATVQGFDGAVFPLTGAPGQQLDIIASPQYSFKGLLEKRSPSGITVLTSVDFEWLEHAHVRLERGVLTASVNNGEPVQRGKDVPLTAGSLSVLATKPNANRRVDIVKPGVEIRVVQPWIKSSGVAGGYHAQRLEVWFSLTQRPAGPLSGFLGATYKP